MGSDLLSVFSMLIPRVRGKYQVHQAEPPYLVRLSKSGRSPGIPKCAVLGRLTHCHSSHRHGAHTIGLGIVFSRFTPLDPLCSVQTRSPLVGCGSSPRTDGLGWRGAMFIRIYHPWRTARSPPQAGSITSGNMPSRARPSQLPLTPAITLVTSRH